MSSAKKDNPATDSSLDLSRIKIEDIMTNWDKLPFQEFYLLARAQAKSQILSY